MQHLSRPSGPSFPPVSELQLVLPFHMAETLAQGSLLLPMLIISIRDHFPYPRSFSSALLSRSPSTPPPSDLFSSPGPGALLSPTDTSLPRPLPLPPSSPRVITSQEPLQQPLSSGPGATAGSLHVEAWEPHLRTSPASGSTSCHQHATVRVFLLFPFAKIHWGAGRALVKREGCDTSAFAGQRLIR